jgi:cation transport ATPase
VDELLHTGRKMRALALQSPVGGLFLSFAGMWMAAFGYLPPVAGAVVQEAIDLLAILNALRIVLPPRVRFDF